MVVDDEPATGCSSTTDWRLLEVAMYPATEGQLTRTMPPEAPSGASNDLLNMTQDRRHAKVDWSFGGQGGRNTMMIIAFMRKTTALTTKL
jgi:hypothetical protein